VMGVATSSNTFLRSFGGAVGLAILGAVMNNRFLSSFIGGIPENVKNAVPMDELTALANNPQALVSPAAQAQLKEILTKPGMDPTIFDKVMGLLQQALSSAIGRAFFIAFLILAVGLIASFFLKGKKVKGNELPRMEN
jgi:hypothetical protein